MSASAQSPSVWCVLWLGLSLGACSAPPEAFSSQAPKALEVAQKPTADASFADARTAEVPPPPEVPPTFELHVNARLSLGSVPVGAGAPTGELGLWAVGGLGSQGAPSIEIEGPFALDEAALTPLEPGEARRVAVSYTGPVDAPRLATGRARVEVDGQSAEVPISVTVADPALPARVRWTYEPLGRQAIASLPSAPFPDGKAPYKNASVLIFVPDGFTGVGGVNAVLHVHGYHARLEESTARHGLQGQLARSGRDAVLIAPQGPYFAADMSLGKLDRHGGLKRLLRDVVTLLHRDGLAPTPKVGKVVLSAHSGGYRGVANMLDRGGARVHAVHLFDALYSHISSFFNFARRGGRLRSSWTWRSATEDENEELTEALELNRVRVSKNISHSGLRRRRVSIGLMRVSHDNTMRMGQAYASWLEVSGVAPQPHAPPVLVATTLDKAGKARVRWWHDPGAAKRRVLVEGSSDGQSWEVLADTTGTEALVEPRPWLRAKALGPQGDSFVSDRYGCTGRDWLVVDGFDRSFGGQWGVGTHGFAAALGQALGAPFSVVSNEAVAEGLVKLGDYPRVLWLVGDEGRDDQVLNRYERRYLSQYLKGGGQLIMSGSNLGEGLRPDTLAAMGARLLDPGELATHAGGHRLDAAYTEMAVDALDGHDLLWTYNTGAGAAVGMGHRVVVVGFGLENLPEHALGDAVAELVAYLKTR